MGFIKPVLLTTAIIASLTACQASPWREFNAGDPAEASSKRKQLLDTMRMASLEKKYEVVRNGGYAAAEEAYRAEPQNPFKALSYAQILRRINMPEQADLILKPFADDPALAGEDIMVEYAKIKLAMGEFDTAQVMAQEASFMNESPRALMLLGVALDAQGHHEAAESNLREALQMVGMDINLKNKILNNLAVSLMAQGRKNEAAVILSQIVDAAGGNADIVTANQELVNQL